ncbi:MAG: hypothetical protein A2X94_17440 [Bdellovibrionales bacterium GWB1_55_8]|nr:MAG: hypothetical protein A2X94_17440 [Bdellovibrionales bacterium GWB1_55_8]
MTVRRRGGLLLVVACANCFLLTACTREQPNRVYMPDMAYSPAVKAQEPGSARTPPEGSIPRDFSPYPFTSEKNPDVPGKLLKNPLQPAAAVLQRGQDLYNTFCIVCHGPTAWGNGTIVPKFPKPPALHTAKARGFPDGRIFHVISVGQNLMPSYKTQILREDRWAIVHYVRVLQGIGTPVAPQAWGPAPEK